MRSGFSTTRSIPSVIDDDRYAVPSARQLCGSNGWPLGLKDSTAIPGEVVAAETLRRDIIVARAITHDFIKNSDDLQIGPDDAGVRKYQAKARACMTALS